ncbi:MAG TPA: tetratricopeptide repeat protein [Xanthobacteraceae bacterium]|nr:tetratricopeptide repeat protein [Xanthobacteraceae bacterium]
MPQVTLNLAVSPSPWLADPTFLDRLLNSGVEHAKKGQIEDAIATFEEALQINPNNALARYNRARSYFEKNEFDQAIADLEKATELEPDLAEAFNTRGCAYLKKGDFESAIDDFSHSIQLNPLDGSIYANRGAAYGMWGAYQSAIQDLNEAIRLYEGDPAAWEAFYNRGVARGAEGQIELSISDYSRSIELKPSAHAFYNRGSSYLKIDDPDSAIADFTRAIELDPKSSAAFYNRGATYLDKDEVDLAISDLSRAAQLDPADADPFWTRAQAWQKKNEILYYLIDMTRAAYLNPVEYRPLFEAVLTYYLKNSGAGNRRQLLSSLALFKEFIDIFERMPRIAKLNEREGRTKNKKMGVARGTETLATLELDRESRWALLGLPETPSRKWKPRPKGRPPKGAKYDDEFVSFVRDVYGPALKGKTPAERQDVRTYIFTKDRGLYDRIIQYEMRAKLPRDIYMPSEQVIAERRRQQLRRAGLAKAEP